MTDEAQQATLPEPTPDQTAPTPEPTPEPAAEPSMEDTIRDTYRELTGERPRGPDGKFLKTTPEPELSTDEPQAEAPEPEEPAEPHPWEKAPNTWRKEMAERWTALDPEVRQEIHRRENDFHKGIAEYRDAAAFGRSIFEDVSPHFDVIRQLGETPQTVVRDVLGAWRALATGTPEQKQSTLLRLAQGFGISLDELSEARDRAPSGSPEIAPVLQRLERLESTLTQAQRAQAEAAWQGQVEQAQKFLTDPKREYMPQVVDDVIALVRAGMTPEDAYDKALWANPDTRAKLLAKQEKERREREAAEAAAARKAAAVNVQRRGTPPTVSKPGTMEDTIRSTYRKLTG